MPIDERRNAHGEHSGLARARTSQDQERSVHMLDRFPLRWVEC
jgi:hypothetical protein